MNRFEYKKVIGFTKTQQKTLETLQAHGVNVNQFIREAIKEKIKREWKTIKENKGRVYYPF